MDIKYIKAVSCLAQMWISAFGLNAYGCHDIVTHLTSTLWRFHLRSNCIWLSRYYNVPDNDIIEMILWYLEFI